MSAVGCAAMSCKILLELAAAHAVTDDVQKGEDARRGAIDDALLEVLEVAPAGSADVDDRRHARARRHDIGIDAVVAGIRSRLARTGVHVRCECRRGPASRTSPTHRPCWRHPRIDLRRDGGDLSAGDRNVSNGADVVSRIDEMAAAQQQVVLLRRARPVPAASTRRARQGRSRLVTLD